MKRCPNCNEWIGDNADVCFNCNYDFISRKIITDSTIKQRNEQRITSAQRKGEQRIATAKARIEQQAAADKAYRSARETELREKLKLNDIFEYDAVTIRDKSSGEIDILALRKELDRRGREGWRLVNTFTNELGVNASSIAGFGSNATIEETILIFERCIKRFR